MENMILPILITLPMPPSINTAYATLKSGVRVKSKAYKDWLKKCQATKQKKYECSGKEKFGITYSFHSKWFNKDGSIKMKDVSNYIKLTDDYLSVLIKNFDDKQIFKGCFYKVENSNNCDNCDNKVVIIIYEIL